MGPNSVAASLSVASHILRSIWEFGSGDKLQSDLAELRLEVFRARELIGSYNRVLENCEAEGTWLRLANRFVTSLNILLVGALVLIFLWAFYLKGGVQNIQRQFKPRFQKQLTQSEDSEEEQEQPAPVFKSGPFRPSSFGKGR